MDGLLKCKPSDGSNMLVTVLIHESTGVDKNGTLKRGNTSVINHHKLLNISSYTDTIFI